MTLTHPVFPVLDTCIYLNHAAVAPWPQATTEAVKQFADENAKQGTLNYPRWLQIEQQLRDYSRQLLNAASSDEIALVKNTSEGLSFVAYGLKWQPGDNIVGISQEFPSNRLVWQSLSTQGVEFRQLDLTQAVDDPEQALLQLCDERTRLITISAVQYTTGLRMDLARVGQFCRAHNILFCVDAIQHLGAIPFDVQAIQADFVVADGHKWLLGAEGLGIFYIRHELLDQLQLTQYGWHMVENPGDYNAVSFQVAQSARRFECGSPNMLGIHALHTSLKLLLDIGIDAIWKQVRERCTYLLNGLSTIDSIEILTDKRPERRSGIITFRSKHYSAEQLYVHLRNNAVFCAPRGGGVRFSPHFYTPLVQLEQVLNLLKQSFA